LARKVSKVHKEQLGSKVQLGLLEFKDSRADKDSRERRVSKEHKEFQ
jgi:hypothetical protein